MEDDQQSSEDDTAEWDSQSDSSGEEELLMADRQADAKLEEGDRLDDAIYEQKLWQTVNGSERGVSLSEDDDSHTPYYSSETDSASSDEDAAIGPGRSETDSEEDRQTTGAVVASDDARPVKRTRMSSGPFAQRSTAAGFADDRRRRKSYRTKEFISTSDEEEEA